MSEPTGDLNEADAPQPVSHPTEQAQDGVQPSIWRVKLISFCLLIGWGIMVGRLVHLQGAQRQLLNTKVNRQSTFTEKVPARPGEVLDRNGHVLAMTITRESLYAVPAEITDAGNFVWEVSQILDINADELYDRIAKHPDRQFIWVRRRLTDDQAQRIRQLNLPKRTWGFRREYLRQYPQGRIAAHVLGMRDIDNIGHGGLEESLDDLIRGVDGTRVMTRDARGKVMEVEAALSETPQHGRTVISTIDVLTQIHTEQLLTDLMERWRPHGACAVVMDPHSGDVLAMASAPNFDPNHPGSVPDDAWRNLAVSAVFEPGSTFKPFIVAWALQQNKLQADEQISCFQGAYRMGKRVLHDHHPYAKLSVEDVLVKSSNIGMARIAERMGLGQLYRATAAFGFGRRTGIELPGEVDGLVRSQDKWDDYSLGSIPMGQELAVTPLQLITAHAALANGGRLVRPHLLLDSSSDQVAPTPLSAIETVDATPGIESQIVRPEIADWIVRHPMKGVVERGTGKNARINGMSIFGKTGTAQKPDPETGGYSNTKHICSFICGAPAENPQVLVLVMVDEPTADGLHYGGTVAAPTAANLLQFALNRLPHLSGRMTVRPEHDLPARMR
ncbi:peptidoglycan D,D-transpeptidase FtsI family protein [Fuerstiella marisgermanici]|uniref:Penicillin-binding protein 2 n=1 Tax=Fuerstiella marisgermanici TaxID=1891926 RepID=A0A1P8WD90_9PLAN|nr:penicillin-binding protein 2 [Fuerstiella marisgermanici]APZ92007.1 Penicillin-binding protein 2 [Fuerstiella marisgermanici]